MEAGIHQIVPSKPRPRLTPAPASIICVTWEDLTTVDLLPYKVQPTAGEDEVDAEDVRLLMIEAGAIWTSFGAQLRFPTKEMASDVQARLMGELPEARWSIIESSFGPVLE